jgi:hypothetical protein
MGNGVGVIESETSSPFILDFCTKNAVQKEDYAKYATLHTALMNRGLNEAAILEVLTKKLNEDRVSKAGFNNSHMATGKAHFSIQRPVETSVTVSENVSSVSPSRETGLVRRKSFEGPSVHDSRSKHITGTVRQTTTLRTAIHGDLERTTHLLGSYYGAHPREHSDGQEGVIFSGSKMMKLNNSADEHVNVLISCLPGPDLTVCNIPVVVEIIVTKHRGQLLVEGELYLSYHVLKDLLATELTKAKDVSTEHMIVAQYCMSRLSAIQDSSGLVVSLKHDSFSAGDTIEKKLERMMSSNPSHRIV